MHFLPNTAGNMPPPYQSYIYGHTSLRKRKFPITVLVNHLPKKVYMISEKDCKMAYIQKWQPVAITSDRVLVLKKIELFFQSFFVCLFL